MVDGIWTIPPKENCPLVGVRVRVRVKVNFRVGGQYSLGVIVLKPLLIHQYRST